jgi:hypothetical protein
MKTKLLFTFLILILSLINVTSNLYAATRTASLSGKRNSTTTCGGALSTNSEITLTVKKVSVDGDIIPQLDFVLAQLEN